MYQFTATNESITLIVEGKPVVVQKASPQFKPLRKALLNEDWDDVPNHLTVGKSLESWAQGLFTFANGQFYYNKEALPTLINDRIAAMALENKDPTTLFKFWERLQRNPSMRSVEQLWNFLQHRNIPLSEKGTFFAYKGVNQNLTDCHTGTIDNSPGKTHEMPRNKISDDPRHECHEGFHVGALEYAKSFGQRVVICEVDPEHVVSVPYDHSSQKMRVCKYTVVGQYNGQPMPSTVMEEADVPERDEEEQEPEEEIETELGGEVKEVTPETKSRRAAKAKDAPKKPVGVPKKYQKYLSMSTLELMKLSLDELRALATHGLRIVGASKIAGGKSALVGVIEANK